MKRNLVFLTALAALFATNATFAKPPIRPDLDIKTLNRSPEKFMGQEVTVSGEVDRIESSNAFVLDGPGIFNDDILVVVADEAPGQPKLTLRKDDKLRVTGRVEEMTVARYEEKYGPLKSEIKAEFEKEMPVISARVSGIHKEKER
jgi:hypothetical protein